MPRAVDPDLERWRAVEQRDARFDGQFFSCVTTTGVYCRPSCAGRPLRRNVVFAATRQEAERAGFRPCKRCRPERLVVGALDGRIAAIDWAAAAAALNQDGFAPLGRLLDEAECAALRELYTSGEGFRSTVVMGRHGFGEGEYKYFSDPPPPIVGELRARLYDCLAPVAGEWAAAGGKAGAYPATHADYRMRCAAAGQTKPTPLLLSYQEGGYNRLHQDLYGSEIFPIQVVILLSEPGKDFTGGEFLLTEQRPRLQTRAHVLPLAEGEAIAFAVNDRPVSGARGVHNVKMRHGVATVRSGRRFALGVIFHDAA